ncbi:MAG TPA: metallophosphoesterase [Candidatus Limnocylindrales bacterium]|nr:metallophosphoesterase [Candidatus Limnocylindrales bacterium]
MRLVHLSDFHFDGSAELRVGLDRLVDVAIAAEPDLVVVTGDLSAGGHQGELDAVAGALDRFGPVPRVVLPGNRDLVPSAGPPGEAQTLPPDSDLDYFLALEPALAVGFGFDEAADGDPAAPDLTTAFERRFGPLEPTYAGPSIHVVSVNSTPRLRSASLERAASRLRRARAGAIRVLALHHGLLPVPGRKLRDGDLSHRAGDVLALLVDLEVDLALHGHIHRAHAWEIAAGHHRLVVSSAGALVNDGRRDASFNEIVVEGGRLEVWRRSVATGRSTLLYEGDRSPAR